METETQDTGYPDLRCFARDSTGLLLTGAGHPRNTIEPEGRPHPVSSGEGGHSGSPVSVPERSGSLGVGLAASGRMGPRGQAPSAAPGDGLWSGARHSRGGSSARAIQGSSAFFCEIKRRTRSASSAPSNGFLNASLNPSAKVSSPGSSLVRASRIVP